MELCETTGCKHEAQIAGKCTRCYRRAWREAHPGYQRAWRETNPDRVAEYRDRYDRKAGRRRFG